ncbi:MAG: thioredoxin family protein [Candidatus Azobacteroides sp.]|nr:thioredoxin family protein [Candidatus Azobacteroides sp.]
MSISKKISWIIGFLFISTLSFAESADNKSSSNEKTIVSDLTKKDFMDKVFNYEKNTDTWVYEGTLPCIVTFYADYCPPCRRLFPTLVELADEYKNKVVIYRVNIEKEKELAAVFGVTSIPTILFIPIEGQPQGAMGALPKNELEKIIGEYLLTE